MANPGSEILGIHPEQNLKFGMSKKEFREKQKKRLAEMTPAQRKAREARLQAEYVKQHSNVSGRTHGDALRQRVKELMESGQLNRYGTPGQLEEEEEEDAFGGGKRRRRSKRRRRRPSTKKRVTRKSRRSKSRRSKTRRSKTRRRSKRRSRRN